MPGPDRPRQLPLDLGHEEARGRDDLVVTAANAEAAALVDRWPDWPGNAVVVAGPRGSGKTHLGEAWAARAGASVFGRDAIDAAAGASGPVFVDDADGQGLDETALFHLLNAARQSGHHVLLTARRFPSAWGVRLPDLASRLKAAPTVEIREPDDELLAGVIAKLFADRQVEVEPHVVQFVVRRIERSLATAIAVVERLDRAAFETKSRITRQLAATVVGAMDAGQAEMDF